MPEGQTADNFTRMMFFFFNMHQNLNTLDPRLTASHGGWHMLATSSFPATLALSAGNEARNTELGKLTHY